MLKGSKISGLDHILPAPTSLSDPPSDPVSKVDEPRSKDPLKIALSNTPKEFFPKSAVATALCDDEDLIESEETLGSKINHLERLIKKQDPGEAVRTRQALLANYCRVARQRELEHLRDHAKKRIEELIKEIDESGASLSSPSLLHLMDFYAICGDLDRALNCKALLPSNFYISESRILDLAYNLVKFGRIDEGIALIEEENQKRRWHIHDKAQVKQHPHRFTQTCHQSEMPWARSANRFLMSVAETTKDPSAVKEAMKSVIKYTNSSPNFILHASVIKAYLSNGDINGAVDEYCRCCEEHFFAPHTIELIKAILLKDDGKNLERVLASNTQLHKLQNTMLDFAIACVEIGFTNEAKKAFKSLGDQINLKRLMKQCEIYANRGQIQDIERILKASQDVVDPPAQEEMHFQLLRAYSKANDAQAALKAYKAMQVCQNLFHSVVHPKPHSPSHFFIIFLKYPLQKAGLPISDRISGLMLKIAKKNGTKPPSSLSSRSPNEPFE